MNLSSSASILVLCKLRYFCYNVLKHSRHLYCSHVHNAFGHPPHFPEISTIYYDRKSSVIQEKFRYYRSSDAWHTDISFEVGYSNDFVG